MVALRGQRASSHPATESSRCKTFTRTQPRCMGPLTLRTLIVLTTADRDPGSGPTLRRGPGPGDGTAFSLQSPGPQTKGKAWCAAGRCRYSVIRFMAAPPGGVRSPPVAPRSRGRTIELARRATARAAAGPRTIERTTHRGPQSSQERLPPLSRALFTAPRTPPPYNPLSYTFGVRGSLASCIFFR